MMLYTISYENRPGYLYAHISGPESYDAAVQFWEELAKKSETENINTFLIVDEVTGRLTTVELHGLSLRISKLFIGKTISFIDPKIDTFDDNKFGENVVYNRGVIAKVFRSEKEGLEWLMKV